MKYLALCTMAVSLITASINPILGNDEIPGAAQKQPIALVGATVHPVDSPDIPNGVVLFDAGRILKIGTSDSVKIPKNAKVINCRKKHIYPGLFEAHSQLGLVEVRAVRASRDQSESGGLNPNVKAHVSVNPDSELIPVTRANGVLLALTAPSGGLISGQASVMQLDGWTFEEMTLKPSVGMMVNWPGVPSGISKGNDSIKQLRQLFDETRAYTVAKKNGKIKTDVKKTALARVIAREIPLLVAANSVERIESAVAFSVEQDVRLTIFGGYDAPLCAALLKKHDVPVIVSAVYRLPRKRSDDYDSSYTLPNRLRKLGIRYCISGSASSRVSNARNLPYHAATAVAFGLPKDEALKAITLYPAQIHGVDDRVGSLRKGKDATLFVTNGDPLETATQVEQAWIQGRAVDLSSRHVKLYEKYREKYRRQAEK
jgi:imidazolonepropionase-like amidohydrolase